MSRISEAVKEFATFIDEHVTHAVADHDTTER
jgi:hypothetical protein